MNYENYGLVMEKLGYDHSTIKRAIALNPMNLGLKPIFSHDDCMIVTFYLTTIPSLIKMVILAYTLQSGKN